MLDQFLSWIFSSWIVFPILVAVLLGLSAFGWRVGLAHSRAKPKETKDGGSVPAAVLTLLGLLLGFTFAITCRCGIGHVISSPRMNDLPAFRLAERVLDARDLQIECMVIGQGQQVKPKSCQRIERFRLCTAPKYCLRNFMCL
jgi:hypothetical protein